MAKTGEETLIAPVKVDSDFCVYTRRPARANKPEVRWRGACASDHLLGTEQLLVRARLDLS